MTLKAIAVLAAQRGDFSGWNRKKKHKALNLVLFPYSAEIKPATSPTNRYTGLNLCLFWCTVRNTAIPRKRGPCQGAACGGHPSGAAAPPALLASIRYNTKMRMTKVILTVRNTAIPRKRGPCQGAACGGHPSGAAAPPTLLASIRYNTKMRMTKVILIFVVHRKEFESLAFGSVDQRSIQLS